MALLKFSQPAPDVLKYDFITVSNRLPVTVKKRGKTLEFLPSPGGLATAMSALKLAKPTLWIGWPGIISEDLTASDKKTITEKLKEYGCAPVFLTSKQVDNYYHGYSNETLWPLFHYFQSLAKYSTSCWESYKEVNKLFAKAVLKNAKKEATVWVHDYHLMLVPKYIKETKPATSVGFFLHIPFPSYEIFRQIPQRQEILEGLMGSDLVGFHIYDYVRHFTSSVLRTLGRSSNNGVIEYGTRSVKADAFPISIDYKKFKKAALSAKVNNEIKILDEHYKNKKIILSVDRLDYSKGIASRLNAFERFLKQNPRYHKKVCLIVIAVPSRTEVSAYQSLRESIEQTISRINGRYSTANWVPVSYQFQNLEFNKLVALYAKSDIALVTPIRDGMNLVAKEYIASKQKYSGVLILSELTGAVDELPESLIVNPNDTSAIVYAIKTALETRENKKVADINRMQQRISNYDVQAWANDFFDQLKGSKLQQTKVTSKRLTHDKLANLIKQYKAADKRLIILDYDGTLRSFVKSINLSVAAPGRPLLRTLKNLCADDKNDLQIISGRPKPALEKWFGKIDIGLVAEHGYWVKNGSKWTSNKVDANKFKKKVLALMKKYTERTPGSILEDKNSSLVWHYRDVTTELAYVRMSSLEHELKEMLSGSEAGVFHGSKILEVKPKSINKGTIVNQLIKNGGYDFVLCCGDDHTDEDMFKVLTNEDYYYSVKSGPGETNARYRVKSVREILSLLKKLSAS